MKKFSTIKYVDAFYISDDTLERVDLYPHTGYGKIVADSKEYIIFSFIQKLESDTRRASTSEKGLLLPKASLSPVYKKIGQEFLGKITEGDILHVEWDDITYFEETMPDGLTKMYTEGQLVMKAATFIVIKDPVTLRTSPLPIKNHPGYTPFYYVLPLSFIRNIEVEN